MSRTSRRIARTTLIGFLLVIVVVFADRHRALVDLTADSTLTLSAQTRDVVGALDRDVEIMVFVRRNESGRVEAVSLLDRYRRLDDRLEVEVVDPDDRPGDARRLGVDPLVGGVAVSAGDDVEIVPFATEAEITAALARLLREDDPVICLTTGHGELALDGPAGGSLSTAAVLLEADGYVLSEADLLADPVIPEGCAMILVAAPTAPFSDETSAAVKDWVDDDGRILVLSDPVSEVDPTVLLPDLGLGLVRGLVFEGDPDGVVAGDEGSPIVRRYASASPVVRRLPPTYFPGVQEVIVDDTPDEPGLTTVRLADTSELSYLETDPLHPEFDPAEDRPGPVTIAGAADRSRVEGADVRRSRAVVVGDVDFLTDTFLREAGNAQLLRQTVGWLTESEQFAALSPNVPRDRPLRLTDGRAAYARLLTVGVVPALFVLAGGFVWALRRSR